MHYVYILRSKITGRLYKGSTRDLKNRFGSHNSGRVRSTRNDKPWELIYYEAFKSKSDARRGELFLKTGRGRERIKYLFSEESG